MCQDTVTVLLKVPVIKTYHLGFNIKFNFFFLLADKHKHFAQFSNQLSGGKEGKQILDE